MPTVTPILRTSKTGKDGRAPLWIRVSDTAGTRFISVGEKVEPKDWDDERKVVRHSHSAHAEINSLVAKKVQAAEAAIRTALLKGKEPTAEGVKRAVRRGKRQDFFDFAEQAITRMERQEKADSARRYRHVVFSKFKAVAGSPLPFDRIDVRLLREFETAMIEKGNARSTVATAFRAVRSIYNKGVAEGLVERADSPFLRFRPAPVPRKKKESLTDAEMRAIEGAELPEDGIRRHARDAFVFSLYCAGMRWKDVCLLRRSHIRRDGDGWRLHVHSISGLLGREDLKTTVRYLADLDQAGADRALEKLFGDRDG